MNSRFGVLFYLALVLSGALFGSVLATQNRFASIFVEFDMELPQATLFALGSWALVYTSGLFFFTLVKEFILSRESAVLACNGIVCLAAIVLGIAYAAAMFMPLIYFGEW